MKQNLILYKNKEFITQLDKQLQEFYSGNPDFINNTTQIYTIVYKELDNFLCSLEEKELVEAKIETRLKEQRIAVINEKLEKLEWCVKELHITNTVVSEQMTSLDENGNYKYIAATNTKINLLKTNYSFLEKYYELVEERERLQLEIDNKLHFYHYDSRTKTYELCNRHKSLVFDALNHTLASAGLTPLSFVKFNALLNNNVVDTEELFSDKEDMYDY